MKRYYSLVERDPATGRYAVVFGDYDRETVEDEKTDMEESGGDPCGPLRIISSGDSQSDIDAAVAKLNSARAPVATVTETESVPLPTLAVGDVVAVYGFLAEVVEKRDYPARVEGVTEGADGPCSQVDLKLVGVRNEGARQNFNFLRRYDASGINRLEVAMLQGNHLYRIPRVIR